MQNSLQDRLLDVVSSNFTKRSKAVDYLSKFLGIGKDAVYRRMRGDTLLTPDEMAKLALHFNISLDALAFENSNTVFFSYNLFTDIINNPSDYLRSIHRDLEELNKLENVKIYYASAEIPLFYYCAFPELIAFKLYVWGRTIWDLDYLQNKPFEVDLIAPQTLDLAKSILTKYRRIPSIEFWSRNIADFTLSQIEYHVISGGFNNKKVPLLLCDRVLDLTNHLAKMATHGRKFRLDGDPADGISDSFVLCHNEMVYTNNTILVTSDAASMLYTAFGNPNFLRSTDQRICNHTQDWFHNMLNKSERISQQSEKSRAWFFNALRRKVEVVKERIAHTY